MTDESLQLKTLQTMLIVFQSHLRPESEVAPIDHYYINYLDYLISVIDEIVSYYVLWFADPVTHRSFPL
jgi:hypothetical protein